MKTEQIFEKIAQQEEETLETVMLEIQKAFIMASRSDEPEAKAFWNSLAPDGKIPEPEKVFCAILAKVLTRVY